jgi:hypothetical protein
MEIIIAIAIIGVGLIWYYNAQRKKSESIEAAEAPKATVNAADLAEPVVITPSLNPMQSLPVTVAEPAPAPVEVVADAPAKKPAAKKAPAKKAPAKKAPAAKKTPVRKSGGKKVG